MNPRTWQHTSHTALEDSMLPVAIGSGWYLTVGRFTIQGSPTTAFSCGARSAFKQHGRRLLEKHAIAPSAARLCYPAPHCSGFNCPAGTRKRGAHAAPTTSESPSAHSQHIAARCASLPSLALLYWFSNSGTQDNACLQLRRAISIQAEGKRLLENHAIALSAARLCYVLRADEFRIANIEIRTLDIEIQADRLSAPG